MRIGLYLILLVSTVGCTSTRSLSRKFSDKPVPIKTHPWTGYYYNKTGSASTRNVSTRWSKLSAYRTTPDLLPAIPAEALIKLTLDHKNTLRVSAYQADRLLGTYEFERIVE